MNNPNIEDIKTFTNKQVITFIIFAILSTFSLTTIYSKFIFNDEEIQINKSSIIENNKHVNARIDKKTGRNSDAIKLLEKRIINLEKN